MGTSIGQQTQGIIYGHGLSDGLNMAHGFNSLQQGHSFPFHLHDAAEETGQGCNLSQRGQDSTFTILRLC